MYNINIFFQICFFLLFFLLVYFLFQNYKLSSNKKFIFVSFSLLLISLVFNNMIYTSANYHYWGLGVFSRTLFFPSLIIFLILSLFLLCYQKKYNIFIALLIFISSAGFYFIQLSYWAESWNIQKKIILNFPYQDNKKFLENDTNLIIYNNIRFFNNIEVFDSQYDLNYAMHYNYPNLSKTTFVVLKNAQKQNIQHEYIELDGNKYYFKNFSNIFIWNYPDKLLVKINKNKVKTFFYEEKEFNKLKYFISKKINYSNSDTNLRNYLKNYYIDLVSRFNKI